MLSAEPCSSSADLMLRPKGGDAVTRKGRMMGGPIASEIKGLKERQPLTLKGEKSSRETGNGRTL